MKSVVRFALASALILASIVWLGCPSMVGRFHLRVKGCPDSGIRSSSLTLHPDGTYAQHHEFKDGRIIDADGDSWKYKHGILHLTNLRIDANGEVPISHPAKVVTGKADYVRPPFIQLPDSACYYMGPK